MAFIVKSALHSLTLLLLPRSPNQVASSMDNVFVPLVRPRFNSNKLKIFTKICFLFNWELIFSFLPCLSYLFNISFGSQREKIGRRRRMMKDEEQETKRIPKTLIKIRFDSIYFIFPCVTFGE